MFNSMWEKNEGYYESLVSVDENKAPILKARAVKDCDGLYQPIIRDYSTGVLLDVGESVELDDAQLIAIEMAEVYIEGIS